MNPPPYSHGPSSRHVATSQIRTAITRPVVSQAYIPPVVSGGYVHISRGQVATSLTYIPTSGMYIPTYGVSHGASQPMTYGPYHGAQYG